MAVSSTPPGTQECTSSPTPQALHLRLRLPQGRLQWRFQVLLQEHKSALLRQRHKLSTFGYVSLKGASNGGFKYSSRNTRVHFFANATSSPPSATSPSRAPPMAVSSTPPGTQECTSSPTPQALH